jgi:glucose uptake protein
MILPQNSSIVLAIMVLSLLFLGAWASLFKAGKWRFELFYVDFAFGLLLAALLFSFTLGDLGYDGFSFLDDLQHAGKRQWVFGFLSGVIFNLGNMLMLSAVSVAGLSIAFPVAYGVALVLASLLAIFYKADVNTTMLLLGAALVFTAVIVAAMSYRITAVLRHEQLARAGKAKSTRRPNPIKGILLAGVGGLLMGSIGNLLTKSRSGDYGLGPYAAAAMFGLGMFFSSFAFDIFFINLPVEGEMIEIPEYLKGKARQHVFGLVSGAMWYTALLGMMVATSVSDTIQPGPFVSTLLSQGAAVLAAILGVTIWNELKGADMRVRILTALMLILYVTGLAMTGLAPTLAKKL